MLALLRESYRDLAAVERVHTRRGFWRWNGERSLSLETEMSVDLDLVVQASGSILDYRA